MKQYTFFWKTGRSEVLHGFSPAGALNAAGYSRGAVQSIDFLCEGSCADLYTFNAHTKKWEERDENTVFMAGGGSPRKNTLDQPRQAAAILGAE